MKSLEHYVLKAANYFKYRLSDCNISFIANQVICRTSKNIEYTVFVSFDGVFASYKVNDIEFKNHVDAMLYISNDAKENINFGASVIDDVEALLEPFSLNPFRVYRKKNTYSNAKLFYNSNDQLDLIKKFNRSDCLLALKMNEKNNLSENVLLKVKKRLSSFNTDHATQLNLINEKGV